VGRLRVTGSRYFSLDAIKAGAPSLAPGTVPNLKRVEHDIVGLNQWPDRTVTPSLKAGQVPDTVDVDLQVDDKLPLHGSLSLDNRRSQDTTPLRLNGSLSYGNLWQRGDSASVAFQIAPQNPQNAEVFSGSYLFRIPDSRMSLLGTFLKSNSNVTTLGSTNVIGKGEIAGLRLLIPFEPRDGFSQSLALGFDYKDLAQETGLNGQSSNVPLIYVPFTVSYQAGWSGAKSQTDLLASVVWAFSGLGSSAMDFDENRFMAPPNFIYLRTDLDRIQQLPFGMEAYARLLAQASPDPLVDSEQFTLGGTESVRGYLESEALGDYGATMQTEIRSPSIASYIGAPLNSLRLHAFFDAGGAGIHNPLPGQTQSYGMASVGAGVRFNLFNHFSGTLEDAETLANGPITKSGSNRFLFRLNGDF
jgi:hemolysin activation/secretion protein